MNELTQASHFFEDESELVTALKKLLSDHEIRAELALDAKAKSHEHFSHHALASRFAGHLIG